MLAAAAVSALATGPALAVEGGTGAYLLGSRDIYAGIVPMPGLYLGNDVIYIGLLHGFGFAGALKEIGLPQADVPLALLAFNLGVEAGQLLFVGFVLLVIAAKNILIRHPLAGARTLAAYLIGVSAMYWLVERLAAFTS